LNPLPGIATGFAIATRFVGMEALALPGAPVDGLRPFESVEQAVRHELMGAYLADPALDWANTLALGRMPAHPAPLSQADFAAGMLLRIAEDFGLAGYGATLRALAARPEAFTASEATANLMAAVRGATGIDYTPLLKTGWQVAAAGLGGGLLDLGLGPAGPLPLAAFGLLGDDLLRAGGTGAFLAGGAGADGLAGGAGADTLIGGTGADRLDGGGGDDLLFAGPGADTVAGGDGADTLRYAAGAALTVTALPDGGWLVEDGYGPDLLLGVEFLAVGDGAAMPVALAAAGRPLPPTAPYTAPAGPQLQTRHGTSGADDLEGGAAGDLLIGHCGADRIAGRRGDDAVEAGCGGDVANGHQGADTLRGGTGADSLGGGSGNDLLDGGADADRLLGHDGADRLDGGSGDDWLFGGTGDDTLTGGEGADTLKGGDGADVFVIDGAAGGIDVVVEFEAGTDRLDLSALRARGGAPRLVQDGDDLRLEADGLTLAVIRDAAPADLALL
ncbi:MAG TPA: calcium-binding protein, partial [Alphaproteobacteria bacterium]|nr:calcium-binding protein [Alphaproteobacteria bacterium]